MPAASGEALPMYTPYYAVHVLVVGANMHGIDVK